MSEQDDLRVIVGADEVGLGCWAGPLVVCAVVAPPDWTLKGLNDSKKLSPKKRAVMYDLIQEQAPFIEWFVEWVWPEQIDAMGVGRARVQAFEDVISLAIKNYPYTEIIVDGDMKFKNLEAPYRSMPKADANVPAVMAASIIAKVERDRWMHTEGDSAHPQYGFINHVGYGTPEHIKALDEHGPCELHRLSYEPVQKRVKGRLTLPKPKWPMWQEPPAGAVLQFDEFHKDGARERVDSHSDEDVPF